MPGYENVALELARALRVNYAQTGDSVGVNKAISAELSATRTHLQKAAWSNEAHYRKKHHGLNRVGKFFEYYWFCLLDIIWGNGESLLKLLRTLSVIYAAFAIWLFQPGGSVTQTIRDTFLIFWGSYDGSIRRPVLVACAVAARTMLLALFVTVLVRRLSRR